MRSPRRSAIVLLRDRDRARMPTDRAVGTASCPDARPEDQVGRSKGGWVKPACSMEIMEFGGFHPPFCNGL